MAVLDGVRLGADGIPLTLPSPRCGEGIKEGEKGRKGMVGGICSWSMSAERPRTFIPSVTGSLRVRKSSNDYRALCQARSRGPGHSLQRRYAVGRVGWENLRASSAPASTSQVSPRRLAHQQISEHRACHWRIGTAPDAQLARVAVDLAVGATLGKGAIVAREGNLGVYGKDLSETRTVIGTGGVFLYSDHVPTFFRAAATGL